MSEENIDLYHYEDHKKITVLAKKTGKEGEYKARCINPSHEDKHPSMGINTIKGVYNCLACHIKGVTWEKHLEGRGKGKSHKAKKGKNYMQEKEDREEKSRIMSGLDIDLENWEGYSPEQRTEIIQGIPLDLCFLSEEEKTIAIGTLVKKGIFRKTELQRRIKKIKSLIRKVVVVDKKGDDKEEKRIKTKTLIPGLVHLVDSKGTIKYLIQKENKLIIEETYTDKEGFTCRPKQDLPICYIKPDILKESREFDYSHLLKDVIRFIKSYLELPEKSGYLILALWVFHTYLIEKFNVTPIIYSYGLMETGKTRTCEVMRELAYKCETLTSPTEATLFRSADYFKNTLVIDEVRLWGKDGNEEVARLIKSRYKRGLKVSRINMGKDKRGEDQVEYFDVFSPLMISTTESIPDIIESRCIRFTMQKNVNPNVERDIDKGLAGDLRSKLTLFRANLIDRELKKVEDISRRRLNEILKPLYQVLMEIDPDRENDFKLIVKQLEESKKSEEGYSDNALMVGEIVNFYNEEGKTFITTKELARRINEDKNIDEFTTKKVGWIVRPFGFQKDRRLGDQGYIINIEILKHLVERYNTSPIKVKGNLFSDQENV
ncbi:hypothetical protein ES705_30400 [subsurface metagenome]